MPRLDEGWRFPAFDVPFHNQLKHTKGDIVDIVSTSFGAYAVSQKVVDIIESIEPRVNQIIPYGMLNPDGSIHPATRWLLNVCTRAEVVDGEISNVVWVDHGGERRKFGDMTAGGRLPHIVVTPVKHRAGPYASGPIARARLSCDSDDPA